MSNTTSATLVRNLTHGTLRKLSDFLDPQDSWKKVLVCINKSLGKPRYSQLHLRRFERLITEGKSPTIELLYDWGTTNCTVGELVDILLSNQLLAPASILLPDAVSSESTTVLVDQSSDTGFRKFAFHELMKITCDFDDRPFLQGGKRLGEGGFGTVYKGFINDQHVAVKKIHSMNDISNEELNVQFNQEIQTLMTLIHENLVDMVGFSCDGPHPCLVYTYMSNGSLLDRLACLENSPPLSWHRRCLIKAGTARGLEYLHKNHHVHRDVKSANILLDETLQPKVSDFGLTRASTNRTSSTVMTERIVGTTAYMAPEALRGEITPKSDVFSFGVVLLEILSGLPPVDENRDPQFLMEMKDEIDEGEMALEEFVDKKMSDWDLPSVEKSYCVAKQCLSERKNRRPLMKDVLKDLEDFLINHSLEELNLTSKA